MTLIVLETVVPASPERCFDLSRSVDLHLASTAQTGERAVAGKTSGMLELGDWVTWEARHIGATRRFTSKIIEYERPHRFTDEMVQGAFAGFRHEHEFRPAAAGTLMVDRLEFRSPFGPVGTVLDAVFMRGYIERLLRERNRYLVQVAEQ